MASQFSTGGSVTHTRDVRFAVAVLFACVGSAALAFDAPEIHCKHFIYGYPTGTPAGNDLIIRDLYAMSSNDTTKFADWVAYRLTPHEVIGTLDLDRKWRSDPWLASDETLEGEKSKDDYKKFNEGIAQADKYDRGHQAPLASFKGSRYASQVNFMSNITPQKSALNQGPWKKLEGMIRGLVREKYGTVWVMTGPLYERNMRELPQADEPHKVPSGYWKIVVVNEGTGTDELKVAAFIFDQDTPRSDRVIDHVVSLANVEQRSNLTFLRELPAAVKQGIVNDVQNATTWVETWE